MGRQHRRGTVGENQYWLKEIVVHWKALFRKITEIRQHWYQQNWICIHLEYPVSTKTARREFLKPNMHDMAAIARGLITESNAQMRKRRFHDHETWTPDKWKHVISSDESSFTLFPPFIRKSLHLENTSKYSMIWNAWFQWWKATRRGFYDDFDYVDRLDNHIPWSRRYFWTTKQYSKATVPPSTQLKLFNKGWKSRKVNFNIFHGWLAQSLDFKISELLKSVLETKWGTDSHLQLL
jgi:hypothetical protein